MISIPISALMQYVTHFYYSLEKYREDFKCSTNGPMAPKPGHHAVEVKSNLKSVQVFACNSYKFMPDSGDNILKCIDKKWSGTPLECRSKKIVLIPPSSL